MCIGSQSRCCVDTVLSLCHHFCETHPGRALVSSRVMALLHLETSFFLLTHYVMFQLPLHMLWLLFSYRWFLLFKALPATVLFTFLRTLFTYLLIRDALSNFQMHRTGVSFINKHTVTSIFLYILQFDSMKPITPKYPNYIQDPLLKDRIHCVVFVFDINCFELLSCELVAKVKQIRRDLIKRGECFCFLLLKVTD